MVPSNKCSCARRYDVTYLLPLVQEAQRLGDEFLSLEKYVNLNYLVRPFPPS